METLHIEYPSSALRGPDYQRKIEEARRFCEQQGWGFGIQIHNTAPYEQIEQLAGTGVALSFHGPLCSEYFMNLAAENESPAQESRQITEGIIKKLAPSRRNLVVFHGFLMTDQPALTFHLQRSYDEALAIAWRKELSQPGLRLCGDFFDSPEYARRFARVKERLAGLGASSPGVTWCIENDYPSFCAGSLLAEQMLAMEAPFCLDVSHLWVSALLYRRDFFEQLTLMAQSDRAACVHLHANTTPTAAPMSEYRDGHRHLHLPNEMDLPKVVNILLANRVTYWILETYEADLTDLQTLADWLGA